MRYLRLTLNLYVNNFWGIMLIALTICLPFLIVHGVSSNMVYFYVSNTPAEIFGDFSNLFLSMVFFVLVQIPIIKFIQNELNEEEKSLGSSYLTFFEYGFMTFLFAILYIFLVVVGMALFVIPGIIILVLFYLTPYVMVYKKQNPFRTLRISVKLALKHFFQILLIIIFMGVIEFLLSTILLIATLSLSADYISIYLGQLFLNLIIFPLITIYTTCRFHDWYDEISSDYEKKSLSINHRLS